MFADAVKSLQQGNVIAVPTEAVYGLSVDPRNERAVQKLLDLKKRNPEKGFILVASHASQLESFIEDLPENILSTWPGPITWVVPAKNSVSILLRGKHQTIAVRVTSHPVLSALCSAFDGPLVSTSANPEGLLPAMSEQEVRDYFGDDILIVAGELGGLDKPTEIRDARTGAVIRA